MNRGARMVLQLFAPAVLVAVSGAAAGTVLLQMGDAPAAAGFAPVGQALRLCGAGAGLAMSAYSLWRLWRWERGMEPQCPCGGLLSRPGQGGRGRSDRIRRCLGCRRPQPQPPPS